MARVLADAETGEALGREASLPPAAAPRPPTSQPRAAAAARPPDPVRDEIWPAAEKAADPVTPAGTDDRGPEWDRAREIIDEKTPRKENQSLRAKILQKSIYLSAAQAALNAELPQTAATIALCSKPLSQALDRSAKKNALINRVVSLVEGTQNDTAMLIGLHACIASAFALESGLVERVIERNRWLRSNPKAQAMVAAGLVSMMTLPQKLLVRAEIEGEDLTAAADKLMDDAGMMMARQAMAAEEAAARADS